ncbi:F-box domain-containing protein [Mycena sanguinolenta]|uniref:F-box domain-containing protein n=1 Tax=Mycena sanguinolenta TaxID=230812 RepID=A0A8H6ZE14_9AGAR|nr:F-box domain-containing protein [Mycena sanguinolenta]
MTATGTKTGEGDSYPRPSSSDIHPASCLAHTVGLQADIADIDKGLAWHYDQIALLKARRNALTPIRRLPNELMIRIFAIVAVESDTLFNLRWTKLMYVCHHWHGLALAAQPLWGFIDLQWHGLGRLFGQLRHSGAAPLSFKMICHEHSSRLCLDVILEQSVRIRDFELCGEAREVYKLIGRLTEYKFPILSSFSLHSGSGRDQLQDDALKDLPEAILRLPSLRELRLTLLGFPWTSLSSLTTLALHQCHDSSTTLPQSFHGLLDMLSSCPRLQSLKLEVTIPPPLPNQVYVTVDLPALAKLYLRDALASCEILLNHLRIPSRATMEILPYTVQTGAHIRGVLVPIRRHLRAIGARTPLMLKISRPDVGYCTITVYYYTVPRTPFDYDPDCPLILNSHPETEISVRQILTKVFKALPSASITHLNGRDGSGVRPVTWRAVILLLPALHTIYLGLGTGAADCIGALRDIETLDPQHQKFPRVRCLHIRFGRRRDRNTNPIVVVLDALEGFTQMCFANGNSLQVLKFDDEFYNLSEQEHILERLFPMVGEIRWNKEVYDPVRRKEQLPQREAERRALMAELGIEGY